MVKGAEDKVYLKFKKEYDILNGESQNTREPHTLKFIQSWTIEQFTNKYSPIEIATGKNGGRYACYKYYKKSRGYRRFISIAKNVTDFDFEKLCVSECSILGGGRFFLLHKKEFRHKTRKEYFMEWENSLLRKACKSLSLTNPFVFDFTTMCNAGKYDVGEYSCDQDFHYFSIAEIPYTGLWSELQSELLRTFHHINVNVCFKNKNKSFVIDGKDMSATLVWPWDPPQSQVCHRNLLFRIGVPKNKFSDIENFVADYNNQMRIVTSSDDCYDYIFKECLWEAQLDAMEDAGMID